MGLWKWIFGGEEDHTTGNWKEVDCKELFAAAAEYTACELAFEVCVNMVAHALGRCEFKTYKNGVEAKDREYWLWNVEPNLNQNSTVFLHKLVDKLYRDNEVLVAAFRHRNGYEMLVVADRWEEGELQVTRMNEYRNVTVDGYTFSKRFREDEVLHLRLNQENIRPVLVRLTQAWARMLSLAKQHYEWDQGQHWKVHVDQMQSGQDEFTAQFAKMVEDNVKPFFQKPNGILPEFDGYKFERIENNAGRSSNSGVEDVRGMVEDIFNFTARAFLIPAVLINGKVEATSDANNRFMTYVLDPLCDQLQEEANRKRYGFDAWKSGSYLRIDSSSIIHYDLFSQAASVEKLIGSGVYSINDVLEAAGQAPINEPWANHHFLTKNIGRIEEIANALGELKGDSYGETEQKTL